MIIIIIIIIYRPVSVHDVLGKAEHLHVEGLLQPAVEAGVAHLCRYVDIIV